MPLNLPTAALPHDRHLAVQASSEPWIQKRMESAGAEGFPDEPNAAATAMSDSGERPYPVQNGVAVVGCIGLMSKYSSWWFGGTSTVRLAAAIRQATADPEVKGILMIVDSPGGFVSGCSDLIKDIQDAAAAKPFDVYMQDLGCSAAFFAACSARKIVANATAVVGSLGVISVVADSSKLYSESGIKIIRLATGALKAAGAPGTKVTNDQVAMLQENVDALGDYFAAVLKKGRKFSDEQLASVFDGAEYLAPKAKQLGLIDGIGNLDAAMKNLVARIESGVDADEYDDCEASAAPANTAPAAAAAHTISPPSGGGTGPLSLGAGTERTRPTPGGEKPSMNFKQQLIRICAALGLNKMATALTVATSEEPEALASVMAEKVQAEVADRLDNDPLMQACRINGIAKASDLESVLEMKALGETYTADLKAEAKAEAIRAYGPENGPKISAQVDNLRPVAIKAMRDSWKAEADVKFGVGENGEGAKRQTAPGGTAAAAAVDTEEDKTPKRAWDRLNADQKAVAASLGATTTEKQDAYAAAYFGEVK
jgi:signal peptide peptidase SppA